MSINCPKCNQECEGEAIREKRPWYLNCECECGLDFAYDGYSSRYYDMDGNEIKEGK